VVLRQRPEVFKEQHFRFSFEDGSGRRLHGVAWKMAHRLPPLGVPLDLAVELTWNHYNGRKLLQMELIDWRSHKALPTHLCVFRMRGLLTRIGLA
jgi:single-stranded-DNA-specific exonuclease